MSRIGSTTNIHQPDGQCMKCKYWEQTSTTFRGMMLPGNCKLAYCRKQFRKETKWSKS